MTNQWTPRNPRVWLIRKRIDSTKNGRIWDAARSWWKGVFFSWKKTGPCDLGDSNGPLRVVKSPKTSEKIVIFGHSKVWEELLMTFLVQLWAKQQNEPYTIHLFESWIQGYSNQVTKMIEWIYWTMKEMPSASGPRSPTCSACGTKIQCPNAGRIWRNLF